MSKEAKQFVCPIDIDINIYLAMIKGTYTRCIWSRTLYNLPRHNLGIINNNGIPFSDLHNSQCAVYMNKRTATTINMFGKNRYIWKNGLGRNYSIIKQTNKQRSKKILIVCILRQANVCIYVFFTYIAWLLSSCKYILALRQVSILD